MTDDNQPLEIFDDQLYDKLLISTATNNATMNLL